MRKVLPTALLTTLELLLAAAVACQKPASAGAPLKRTVVRVDSRAIAVEIAATDDERRKGYMRRDPPGESEGMLFVFPDEQVRSFWNHDVPFAIDIAFMDGEGRVVSVARMAPMDNRSTSSRRPAKYALEMRAGAFETCGLSLGSTVEIPGNLGLME